MDDKQNSGLLLLFPAIALKYLIIVNKASYCRECIQKKDERYQKKISKV